MSLFTELKRCNVFRIAVVYAATAFVVLQSADFLFGNVGRRRRHLTVRLEATEHR